MTEYEWLVDEANASVTTGTRSTVEDRIISAGAEADASMELYNNSTYWLRTMSEAAHSYAGKFDLVADLEAQCRLLVD